MLRLRPTALATLAAAAAALGGCQPAAGDPQVLVPGGDAGRGRVLIARIGCGGCHAIPGVPGANGRVGPPLDKVGRQAVIAGVLPNIPDDMVRWIRTPQSVVPGNAMPNMEIDDHDARDVAAYLYTLR